MARQIKWRLQFKSLNGTGCLVNIYEEGYTGSGLTTSGKTGSNVPFTVENGVTSLLGAATPFEYEEDNSNDLLHFVRYKTGYMRVIEETYGQLTNLQPNSIRHHYIEAYYGSEIVFSGFQQCAEYSNEWIASPRELEFPIVSPLGLLDAFNFTPPSTPGMTSIGTWMQQLINGLDAGYSSVIYPGSSYAPWNCQMHSTIICPFNGEFKHFDSADKLWSPKSYLYLIEGICACFGWTVHDTPAAIVFAKFDASTSDSYSQVSIAGLTSLSGRTSVQQLATALNTYYSNYDDAALLSVVRPLKDIEISLDGDDVTQISTTTAHATTDVNSQDGNSVFRGWKMTQVGPDVSGDHIGTATFDTVGNVYYAGLFPIAYGKIEENAKTVSLSEFWVIKYSSSWTNGSLLIKSVFNGIAPKNSQGWCLLKIKMERGTSLQNMQATGYSDLLVNLVIKVGSQYVNLSNDSLTNYETRNAVTISGETGSVVPNKTLATASVDDCDGILFRPTNGWWVVNQPIEVSIYHNATGNLQNGEILKVTDLSLRNPSSNDKDYNSYYNDRNKIKLGGNATGTDGGSVTVNFNNYAYHMGQHSFGDDNRNISGNAPTFGYMFQPLTVLVEKMKRTATAINHNEYAARYTYWINGWRWRLLAKSFSMRDDLYTMTIARSSTIE